MAIDERGVIHFMVEASANERGLVSAEPKNAAVLPPVLKAALTGVGKKWHFACKPTLAPSLRHGGTDQAGLVNCLLCRQTQAWIDAPDDGAYPKDPNSPAPRPEVDEYL